MSTRFRKINIENGITLIALVITIIVLLILTGVTIVSITGENGLLGKAKQASDDTKTSQEKEILQIEAFGSIDGSGRVDFETLKNNIQNNQKVKAITSTDFPLKITFLDTQHKYKIDQNGNVTEMAEAEINLSETSGTVIAGNKMTFSITYEGDCTLNAISINPAIATVSLNNKNVLITGVSQGITTIVVSATGGTNYAVPKQTTYRITVKNASYEVSMVQSGKQKYHSSLQDAVNAANAGATIKVLANTSESASLTITKNITINTNGKTLTRTNGSIIVSAGTVTVSGTGTIQNTNPSATAITVTEGTFKTTGTPLIQAKMICIKGIGGGEINLQGGYVYSTVSTNQATIVMQGSGNLTITDTYVYSVGSNNSAIWFDTGSTGNLTLTGNSHVGSNENGESTAATIALWGNGNNVTASGNAEICAGQLSGSAISYSKGFAGTLTFSETASAYMTNTNWSTLINCQVPGFKANFNTNGWLYSAGTWVGKTTANDSVISVLKGKYVSRNNPYMFIKCDEELVTYKSTNPVSSRTFNVFSNYNTIRTITITNCYYYVR